MHACWTLPCLSYATFKEFTCEPQYCQGISHCTALLPADFLGCQQPYFVPHLPPIFLIRLYGCHGGLCAGHGANAYAVPGPVGSGSPRIMFSEEMLHLLGCQLGSSGEHGAAGGEQGSSAEEEGTDTDAVLFVMCHEMAHLK